MNTLSPPLQRLSLEALRATLTEQKEVCVWTIPSQAARVQETFPFPQQEPETPLPSGCKALLAVGGGWLLDAAKAWRHDHAPNVALYAIPSRWGSGAECSPVVVQHDDTGQKQIRMDDAFFPDAIAYWPELAAKLTPAQRRDGCGDTWAHTLEGFLSPLAEPPLQADLAALLREILALKEDDLLGWFEASGLGAYGQSRASVGLIHGIAHTLEPIIRRQQPDQEWGHARLCRLFLWPVSRLNREISKKYVQRFTEYDLPLDLFDAAFQRLFDLDAYRATLGALEANWIKVLRDPCTRTNSALVRRQHLDYFLKEGFLG